MFEAFTGIVITLVAAVMLLFKRNAVLKVKAAESRQKAHRAEQAAAHNAKVTEIIVEREAVRPQAVQEAVDEALENDFSDYYDNDK